MDVPPPVDRSERGNELSPPVAIKRRPPLEENLCAERVVCPRPHIEPDTEISPDVGKIIGQAGQDGLVSLLDSTGGVAYRDGIIDLAIGVFESEYCAWWLVDFQPLLVWNTSRLSVIGCGRSIAQVENRGVEGREMPFGLDSHAMPRAAASPRTQSPPGLAARKTSIGEHRCRCDIVGVAGI